MPRSTPKAAKRVRTAGSNWGRSALRLAALWRPCESFKRWKLSIQKGASDTTTIPSPPSPALQNNEYCLVVLLKWNGHLVHFNSRQGKAAVQDSKPIRLSLPFSYQQDGEESIYVWTLKKRIQSSSRNHARHDIHPARPPASDQHMGGGICAASPASPVDDEVNVGAPICKFPRPANDGKLSPFPYIFHFSIQKRREPHCVAGELEQQETPDAR